MTLLEQAVAEQRWDLAAHAVVLAAIRVLNEGDPDGGTENRKEENERWPEREKP